MNKDKENKINIFESKSRLKELNINENLEELGFSNEKTLADIGSGTGTLIFEASKCKDSKIYSVEMLDVMIDIQKDKIKNKDIENIEIVKQNVDRNEILIEDEACDFVTMITVLHEIDDKDTIMKQINRILKSKGKLFIIEFHKKETDFGPPLEERLSIEYIEDICSRNGLSKIKGKVLGDNFYSVTFQKS